MNTTKTIIDILKEHNRVDNTTLTRLDEKLLFLKNGTNLLIGASKSGKTYTTLKLLVNHGFKENIIHIDFDRNKDPKLKKFDVQTYNIAEAEELLTALKRLKKDSYYQTMTDKIFIIDSLQDLSSIDGFDTNLGALNTTKNLRIFQDSGATIILIHHVTIDANNNPKTKGNSSVITSKCDTTILLKKITNTKRIMTVSNTRSEHIIPSGTEIIDEPRSNCVPK